MDPEKKDLELIGVIAFDGLIRNGLCLHPDGEHLIYPMGKNVIIKKISTGEQNFLTGHQNFVSAVCVSPCGKYIASGQTSHHGFKTMVIIWDYEKRVKKASYEIHKVTIEALRFTHNSDYLLSLGGRDDGNLVVWDVQKSEPFFGSTASSQTTGNAYAICGTNVLKGGFLTAGDGTFKVWHINPEERKVYATDVKVGKIKRKIECIVIDENDENAYCGTTSGDILKARLHFPEKHMESGKCSIMLACYAKLPRRSRKVVTAEGDLYSGGVKNLLLLPNGRIIVATGDGTLELIEIVDESATSSASKKSLISPSILTHRTGKVCSGITSMVLHRGKFLLVGTISCEIYEIELSTFRSRAIVTCHTGAIYDIAFPRNHSTVFATAGKNDIRLWKLKSQKELLRITVPNFACSSLCFDHKDQTIISAWSDGAIRGFSLNGGKVVFVIRNAHTKPVSAIAITNDGTRLVSGGCDGQVRIWDATSEGRKLLLTLKEHRGPVTCVCVPCDEDNLISSSTDGTCIVWDAKTYTRKHLLMGNTMYMSACFSPDGVQIFTCGTDHKIAYWETWDGSLVRQIEGSAIGTLNYIDCSRDGRFLLSGSNDSMLKLWDYKTASIVRIGLGHAAAVTACKFSPDGNVIVSASADGAIMIWQNITNSDTPSE